MTATPTLLNLSDFIVLGVKESEDDYQIEVASRVSPCVCPHCGVVGPLLYRFGTKHQLVMDVPMHGKRVGLLVHRQKYRCRECDTYFYERLPALDEKRLMTCRLVSYIEREALRRTFVSVADECGLDEKTIRNVFAEQIARMEQQRVTTAPEWLGIDEVKITRAMRCVLTNMKEHLILDVLQDRKKRSVLTYLQTLPNCNGIQLVSMDMWDSYRLAVRQALPKAKIVVDKFHIVRMANQSLEAARKAIRGTLSDKQRKTLMHDRFILLHRRADLDASKLLILESWTKNLPLLGTAYELKESFFDIWLATDRNQALSLYQDWQQRVPVDLQPTFQPLLSAMKNWQTEIFNYFEHPLTNAYTEALNGIIKATVHATRGASFEVVRAKMQYRGGLHVGLRPKYGEGF